MKIKSKRKWLFALLSVAFLLLGAAVLSACKIGKDEFGEFREKYNLSGSVVYYANGGAFGNKNSDIKRKELYFSKDAPMLNISGETKKIIIVRENYTIVGWKIALGGEEDGEPVIDENDPWVQFPRYIGEDEHLVVYAVWSLNASLDYYLVSKEENFTLHDSEGNAFTTGGDEPFYSSSDTENDSFFIYQQESKIFGGKSITDATLVGFYDDRECTVPHAGNRLSKPADGSNGKIYVRYIAGSDWTILKTSTDVSNMFGSIASDGAEGKKFLLYDSIDCSRTAFSKNHLAINTTFKGRIEGEGHTISNLNFGRDTLVGRLSLDFASDYSLFGKIGSDAVIRDLTIDTLSMYYTLKSSQATETIAAIAYGVESGATLAGFTVKNLTLSIQAQPGTELKNFDTEEDGGKLKLKDKDMWVFGGVDDKTDSAVLAQTGVVLTDPKIEFVQD